MEESVCGTTSEPFEEKSLDSFVPKSESEFVECAELITRKLRSFKKNHHYVAFLKAMNELTLDALNASDAEEVASSLSVIAQKQRKSQEDANAGKQNTDTHKWKHLHMDKLCYSSVFNRLVFWRRRKPFETLSENLVFEILTRLPAEDVLRCRLVCRTWREVTLTSGFIAKHAERAPKTIIVHENNSELSGIFYVFGRSKKKPMVNEFETRYLTGMTFHTTSIQGCNGWILQIVGHPWEFSICNPFTGEELCVGVPDDVGAIFGFFFHPDEGDYRVLFGRREGDSYVYTIFNLSTMSWRRLDKTFSYKPMPRKPHVMVNRFLHWKAVQQVGSKFVPCCCEEFIITFNIDTEEFALRSHPEEEGCSKKMHERMHLMEGDGDGDTLLFAHVFGDTMTVWFLEDYTEWGWERKYRIDLKWNVLKEPLSLGGESIRPVCIQGDELFIIWEHRGEFMYHLKRGTVKEIVRWYYPKRFFWTHWYAGLYKKTFVSFEGAWRHKINHNMKVGYNRVGRR